MIITLEDAKTVTLIYINTVQVGHIAKEPHICCMKPDPSAIVPPMVMLTRSASETVRAKIAQRICKMEGATRKIVFRDPPPPLTARQRIR